MTVREKDVQILQHIVKHCDRILDTISYFGGNRSLFMDNHIYQGNVSINLEAIGEISRHLSDDFLKKTKEIPWKQIKGQRNIFAHGYDTAVDFSKVWDMITEDIPFLREFCADMLKDNNSEIIRVEPTAKKITSPRRK